MTEETAQGARTFYIVGAAQPAGGGDVATVPGKGDNLHSLKSWFGPAVREVPADRLLDSFDKTRQAIDAMLDRIEDSDRQGFRLEAFEVSLAVSGEGTIGLVTATAEAGVVLKFARAP